jgi:hypothetical protein
MISAYRILVRKPEGKKPLGRWGANIKLNLKGNKELTRFSWLQLWDEPLGFIKSMEFLDEQSKCQLFKKDSSPWR